MVYNPTNTGHVVMSLDNGTTAMTGLQDHPGTGYTLGDCPSGRMNYEAVAAAMGVPKVHTLGQKSTTEDLESLLRASLSSNDLTLIVMRSPCLLAAKKIRAREQPAAPATAGGTTA